MGINPHFNLWRYLFAVNLVKRTVLVDEALPYSKVAQRVKEALAPTKDSAGAVLDFVYPVPGHPPMRPKPGFVDFVSFLASCSFLLL